VAWPSVARLMRDTGLSRATIKRATKWLETQGYLRVLRTTKAHGEREVNRYRPTLRRAQVAAQDVGTEAVSEGGGLTTMSPRTSDDIPLNEPLNKTQSQKELGEEEREELRGNSASLSPDPKNLEAECYRLAHP